MTGFALQFGGKGKVRRAERSDADFQGQGGIVGVVWVRRLAADEKQRVEDVAKVPDVRPVGERLCGQGLFGEEGVNEPVAILGAVAGGRRSPAAGTGLSAAPGPRGGPGRRRAGGGAPRPGRFRPRILVGVP